MQPIVWIVLAAVIAAIFLVTRRRSAAAAGLSLAPLGGGELESIRAELGRGELGGLQALLAPLHVGRFDDRDFYLWTLARDLPREPLDDWCRREPESALARLVRGVQGVEWAWQARGLGMAAEVSDDAHDRMRERADLARTDLLEAARLDPLDPTPHAYLIETALALGEGPEQAMEFFREAVAREPEHYSAHHSMHRLLTAKWGGSHEQMFQFARDAVARAPHGTDLVGLLFTSYVERWLYSNQFERNRAEAKAYVQDPAVRAEAAALYDGSLAAAGLRERRSTIRARNAAAFWFYLAEDRPRLRQEVLRIGNACTDMPWHFLAPDAYATASRWAFRYG